MSDTLTRSVNTVRRNGKTTAHVLVGGKVDGVLIAAQRTESVGNRSRPYIVSSVLPSPRGGFCGLSYMEHGSVEDGPDLHARVVALARPDLGDAPARKHDAATCRACS